MEDVIFSFKEAFDILLKILIGSAIITIIIFARILLNYYFYSVKDTIISGFKNESEKKLKQGKNEIGFGFFFLRTFILTFLGIIVFLFFYSIFIEGYKAVHIFLEDHFYYDQWYDIFKIIFTVIFLGISVGCFYKLYFFSNNILKRFGISK